MKKLLLLSLLLAASFMYAQDRKPQPGNQAITLRLHIPLGAFSETHFGGTGLAYTWYGRGMFRDSAKRGRIHFTFNGGADLYVGRKEEVVTATYTYPVFLFVQAYGGLAWKPAKPFYFTLTAGPALGLYHGVARFNLGANANGRFIFSSRLTGGPGLQLMKEKESDPLWAGSLSVQYHF